MVSPYGFDYDTPLLAIPLTMVCLRAQREGWSRGEQALLVACWVLPLAATSIAYYGWRLIGIGVQIMPWAFAALAGMLIRRALREH